MSAAANVKGPAGLAGLCLNTALFRYAFANKNWAASLVALFLVAVVKAGNTGTTASSSVIIKSMASERVYTAGRSCTAAVAGRCCTWPNKSHTI